MRVTLNALGDYLRKKNPIIDGKKVVIWTMKQLVAGSSYGKQIQENLNKSDFGFGALSQQFLQSDCITTQEMPHFLQQKSLFLFGLDKRINGNNSSVDNFFSKVSKTLSKNFATASVLFK
ncbi:hypothetical protein [uncultured Gammaproteobacteria bacterium]|nr:hypothetical protein [uncultured Gammaproteobacteria bacterium]